MPKLNDEELKQRCLRLSEKLCQFFWGNVLKKTLRQEFLAQRRELTTKRQWPSTANDSQVRLGPYSAT